MFFLILLFSCSNKVINHRDAYIFVIWNGRVLQDGDTIYASRGEITFAYMEGISKGMTPRLYMHGNMTTIMAPFEPEIRRNITYSLKYKLRSPGKATLMFIWESKNKFGQVFTLKLQDR